MAMVVIALLFSSALCGLALRANGRFQSEKRLPMQWWFTGDVTWYAPRPIAVALIPVLGLSIIMSLIVLSRYGRVRPGQEGLVLPTLVGIGIMFLAMQLLHLWLVEKTLQRNGSLPPRLCENALICYDGGLIWEACDGAFHRGLRPTAEAFSA